MADATFRHGDPVMMDHTAAADIDAGEIVLIGNTTGLTCGVAHLAIANAAAGSLAIGGGIYDVKVAGNYTAGSAVYWDLTNTVLTTTSTNMSFFGFTLETAAAANAVVEVVHDPRVK